MRAIIKKFASFARYTSGEKTGEANRLEPQTPLRQEGTQPGATSIKIAAEEMNFLLNNIAEQLKDLAVARLADWQIYNADPDPDDGDVRSWSYGYGRHPGSGTYYGHVLNTTDNEIWLVRIDPEGGSEEISLVGDTASSGEASASAFAPAADPGGNGPGMYFTVRAPAGDVAVWYVDGNGADAVLTTIGYDPADAVRSSIWWDSFRSRVHIATSASIGAGDLTINHVLDGAVPALVASAVPAPGTPLSRGVVGASDAAGNSMVVGHDTASDVKTWRTTDGTTWIATSDIPTALVSPSSQDLAWYPSGFLGSEPAFVAVVRTASTYEAWTTEDLGASWSLAATGALASAVSIYTTVLMGDWLIVRTLDRRSILAVDMSTGKISSARLPDGVSTVDLIMSDPERTRVFTPAAFGLLGVSAKVRAGLATDLTELDA